MAINHLPHFDQTRILVYGDIMLDRYWYGQTSRISPEAPVPVVHVRGHEIRPGGAANVALNMSSLGCIVKVMGIVGDDLEGQQLRHLLNEKGVLCEFLTALNVPTVTKLRVIGQQQQLLRMDFEETFQNVDDSHLIDLYQKELENSHIVVLSDYAKGTLKLSAQLIAMAKRKSVPVLVDPKSNDLNRYRGADIITPNRLEFENIVGHCRDDDDLIDKGRNLIKTFELGALLVTRGKEGMTLIEKNGEATHFSAKAQEVYDVTGAGDTVIGVIAAALGAGNDVKEAINFANIAAGLVVKKLGAATVSVSELRRALLYQGGISEGILTESELMIAVEDARAHGETVVMTNGCFDILHAGHVQYLINAKALGKRLIVAVNDDDSVRRLKGHSRPLNPLLERMMVLAGLRSVDWVVPFSEDTPERIISHLLPDILVKGGDYIPEQIAGFNHVINHGGKVEVLNFREGCSTSSLIKKIREEVV